MSVVFPSSPSIGDEVSGGGFTWTWNGVSWSKLIADTAEVSGRNFNIDVGTSGNTTFEFTSDMAAGQYAITSQLNDPSMDIYLIASDNTNAGYTSTKTLVATKPFKKVVVYGATNNDVLTFEYKVSPIGTGNGNVDGGAAAYVTSINTSTVPNIGSVTTITGGNFASNVEVRFVGTDNSEVSPKTIIRNSSTSLTVTRPDVLPIAFAPYDIKVYNPGVELPVQRAYVLNNVLSGGVGPTWTTAASLLPYTPGSPYSNSIVATDADGTISSYSIISGSLPSGLSLNTTTGLISGTTSSTSTATFTVRATDSGSNTVDRTFSLPASVSASGGTQVDSGIYRYHTFTSSGTFTVARGGTVEIITLAGGGSGNSIAGGGAGGMLYSTTLLNAGSYELVVGAAGNNTTFGSLTALTAIRGGNASSSCCCGGGNSGGSGGGNSWQGAGGAGTAGQGHEGGPCGGSLGDIYGADGGTGGGGKGGGGGGAYYIIPGDGWAPNSTIVGGSGGSGTDAFSEWGIATSTGELSGGKRWYAAGGAGYGVSIYGYNAYGGQSAGRGANTGGGGRRDSTAGSSGLIMIRYPR